MTAIREPEAQTSEPRAPQATPVELRATPLLPQGFEVPASRWTHPATRFRELLRTQPYLFGPGVYDPMGAQLVMYHGYKAVYFSGYSFAIGHLGTTDMDLYSGPEIADGARRTVSALRKFQLTMAVGDPAKGIAPRHLDIPPVVVDMDAGYGNIHGAAHFCPGPVRSLRRGVEPIRRQLHGHSLPGCRPEGAAGFGPPKAQPCPPVVDAGQPTLRSAVRT